jgi:hypothetical protein
MDMKKNYLLRNALVLTVSCLALFIASCKKDSNNNRGGGGTNPIGTPTKLGFYEVDSSIYKVLLEPVTKIGTQPINYDLVFDTGSGGLVIDAHGIVPSSMITTSGFNFTGDSTVVNGITITKWADTIAYGDDNATTDKVYGNLAYADVVIGDNNGKISVKRLPFFLYYKAVDGKGKAFDAHEFDVFGVSPEYDLTFQNGAYITSPFSYFDPGTGLTKGFKMDALGTSNYSLDGTYVSAITLGLTSSDLTGGGYIMNQLTFVQGEGYIPIIPATLTYNGKSVSANVLYDTGTEPYSYLEDRTATNTSPLLLAANTTVSIATTSGFNYSFTTAADNNLTYLENPKYSGSDVTILSLNFFTNNAYLLDFEGHKLGVKAN